MSTLPHAHRNHRDSAPEGQRFTCCGKQVLLDGEDFAQARTPEAAMAITDCMNNAGVDKNCWPKEAINFVRSFFA